MSLCSSDISTILTYTISKSAQSSDLQLPNSYQGITDICCHSVGPSCMGVLRIPLWLTHYDFYYHRVFSSIFPAIHCFKCSRCHPSIKIHSHQHPLHAASGPCPRTSETSFHQYKPLESLRSFSMHTCKLEALIHFPTLDLLEITFQWVLYSDPPEHLCTCDLFWSTSE